MLHKNEPLSKTKEPINMLLQVFEQSLPATPLLMGEKMHYYIMLCSLFAQAKPVQD